MSKCGGSNLLNTVEFKTRGIEIHGKLYEYDLVNYVNNQTKVIIKCNQCRKLFKQRPDKHMMGRGCPNCGARKGSINNTKSFEKFESDAIKTHGKRFTYFKYNYKNRYTKTNIKCNICKNIFKQTPTSHIGGSGCPNCAGNSLQTKKQFIESVKQVKGNSFDYSQSIYVNDVTKLIIKCNICNKIFNRRPFNYRNGAKCPYCIRRISILESDFMDYCKIPNDKEHRQLRIKQYAMDGYDNKTNTIYEYLGDYWHGNPIKFKSFDLNKIAKLTFKELYDKTFKRLDLFKSLGYNIKYIWENDWKRFKDGFDKEPKIINY